MFEGFDRSVVPTSGTEINCLIAGSGPPVLLLHGYPETHVCWHGVAPAMARKFTVVCADLRGCGDSGKPESDPDHIAYSKRVMADDQVEAMTQLGFDRFAVVGHDRGARVAHRMALDHADAVTKLALLDIVPTAFAFENVDKDMATAAFNWFFSIQPDDLPERMIGAQPEFYIRYLLEHWAGEKNALTADAVSEYVRCFDRECIRATCEEFRAAAGIDLDHDDEDRDKKIACPTLVLWSSNSMWANYDIMEIWRSKAVDVSGRSFDCGHFLPEEDPDNVVADLLKFL